MKSINILKSYVTENVNKKLFLTEISKKLKLTLTKKFKKEKPDLTDEILNFYIDGFERFKNSLPAEQRDITKYTFDDLEHLVDARIARRELKKGGKKVETDYDEEDLNRIIYDKNNLKILKGPSKDACIKYGQGHSTWCIARSGGSNLFYNYRYGNNLTIYFVVDSDKSKSDVNAALVILVDPHGDYRLADKTNSGRYSGHQEVPWSEILKKQPKLEGLEDFFKPNPLTDEEKKEYNRIRNVRVGSNPYDTFKSWNDVEKWMEFTSPNLSDEQYSNLLPELQKKYIALGFDLSPKMIKVSDSDVIKYYKKKKVEKIERSGLNNLTKEDIALLNHPSMIEYKEKLQPKLAQDLAKSSGKQSSEVEINYPDGDSGKYIALYGFGDLFDFLPKNLTKLAIDNRSDQDINLVVPDKLGEFKDLQTLVFKKCLSKLPDSVGQLKDLNFIILSDNPNLKELPQTMDQLENIHFINLTGTPAKLPPRLSQIMTDEGGGFYWTAE